MTRTTDVHNGIDNKTRCWISANPMRKHIIAKWESSCWTTTAVSASSRDNANVENTANHVVANVCCDVL